MVRSFDGNPAVHFSIGRSGRGYASRKRQLAEFMYSYCKRRNGIYLSRNSNGLICFYESERKANRIADFLDEVKLVFFAVGLFRLLPVIRRNFIAARRRNAIGPHIHCWYLGVKKGMRDYRTAAELRDKLFTESERLNLPVLAETTMIRNKNVYERMGFMTYDEIVVSGMRTYLMMYHPSMAGPGTLAQVQ